jgi:hypothetical protein
MRSNHNIDDLQQINDIIEKQQYVQAGGLPMVIAKIGEFLLIIVMKILEFLWNMVLALFRFRPELSLEFPFIFASDNGEALFFKFCWLAVKGGFYLAVFAFGGPLLALVAIGFMYKNLFAKFKELKKTEEEQDKEGGND